MRVHHCPTCQRPAYPESIICICSQPHFLDPIADELLGEAVPCANRDQIGCSWTAEPGGPLCLSCDMTEITPDQRVHENIPLWSETEAAKRWALLGLIRIGWFRTPDDPRPEFLILSEQIAGRRRKNVMMGHASGVITLNIMEADPAIAIDRQQDFDEPLRTMVGHVRHEMAHFLFDRLVATQPDFQAKFRELFGDESADYGAALEKHYETGPAPGWEENYISEYATAHPHEDWAETAAHVLHMRDLSHSGAALGIGLRGHTHFDRAQHAGIVLNHLCRSLGQPDPYPLIISTKVREKLEFAEDYLVRDPKVI
ncbi:putative zinc-binding metallopeptidase [Rhodobacteraceae bacterium NNCM2]|nr:putative zinc-binding metallopeptidase [Coraliihabitans acroporae]